MTYGRDVAGAAGGGAGKGTVVTPEQVRTIVEEVVSKHSVPGMYLVLVPLLLAGAVSLAAIFLGAYLKKKAEHFATNEDFQALTEQLRRTTRATEEIKAAISSDVWLRQQRWDLRRDIYSRLLTGLDDLVRALDERIAALERLEASPTGPERRHATEVFELAQRQVVDAFGRVATGRALGGMLLVPDAVAALLRLTAAWNTTVESPPTSVVEAQRELSRVARDARSTLTEMARRDLLDEPATRP